MNAQLYSVLTHGRVRCHLCAHACLLLPGQRGLCGVRENVQGALHTLVGDNVVSVHVDPVEKKPLYHYRPGSGTFSMGTMGCNFACRFCQNADISRHPARTGEVHGQRVTPEALVQAALESGCRSLAFTYNEPTVFFELMLDTAQLATEHGLDCLMVSNGYQSPACLEALAPYIRAVNIDLKSFCDDFYRTQCKARLAPVLDNLRIMRELGWWLEVTTLVIPGLNDSPAELEALADFIHEALGAHTPWHVSAFHPCFEMLDRPRTPESTLVLASEIGLARGLLFVYPGNAACSRDTLCPACGQTFIERQGWNICKHAPDGRCPGCGTVLPGIWD